MRLPDLPTPLTSPRVAHGRAILELLATEGRPLQRSEIRRRLGLGEAQLSHLLRDLEADDLIRRLKPEKGREVLVDLGQAGREVVKAEILPGWVQVFLSEISAMRSGWRTKPEILKTELERAGAPSRLLAERLTNALQALGTPRDLQAGEVRDRDIHLKSSGLDEEDGGIPSLFLKDSFELREEQRKMLEKTAVQRGGGTTPSGILQEAVDFYFDQQGDRKALVRAALSVLGTLDEGAAGEMEDTVLRLRSQWR